MMFKAKGDDNLFYGEIGGHRIQQMSGSGKKKKLHTSTITIAVLEEIAEYRLVIRQNDLEYKTCRSTGSGGQSINTTDSAVQLTHIPSGLSVRCESEKSQTQNRVNALNLLRAKLWDQQKNKLRAERCNERKEQVGAGQRGDKRRTIRYQDEQVNDHITGKHWQLRKYLKGEW